MQIIDKNVDELIPYVKNPRKNDKAVDPVAKSIKEFGFKVPIVITSGNEIICGHTRLKAAQKLKLETVPCVIADDLTEEQIKAFRLADNKVSELAIWDVDLLAGELTDIGMDMSEFGFSDIDMNIEDKVIEDEYDETPPEEPKSKLGQIYKLGRHRLMCGDSTSGGDISALMGGQKADLLLTDPPYNVALGMGGSKDEARKRHRHQDGLVIMNDKMEDDKFREFLTTVFINAKENMKAGAAFYIWHADNEGYNFRGACIDAGFFIRQIIIWNKNAITLGRQDYQWKHEPCLYGWNDGASHSWYSDRKQSTVLDFDRPTKSTEHPTMKPIALFDYQIKNSSKGGDIVLDMFGGSGTTIMACEQNGRNAYVMELDPRYVDVIIKRWETFTGQKAELIEG